MRKILLLLPLLLIFSCSVQKRKYQKGYHFTWTRTANKVKEKRASPAKNQHQKAETPTEEITSPVYEYPEIIVAKDNHLTLKELHKKKNSLIGTEPCDELIFRDGSEVKAKVLEITSTELRYKKCDALDGPTYIAKKSDIFMVKYSNGTREVFRDQGNSNQGDLKKATYKGAKINHPMASASLVMGLLSFLTLVAAVYVTPLLAFFSPLFAILAVIFGIIALRKIYADPDRNSGDGMAIAGLVIGILLVALWLILIIAVLSFI